MKIQELDSKVYETLIDAKKSRPSFDFSRSQSLPIVEYTLRYNGQIMAVFALIEKGADSAWDYKDLSDNLDLREMLLGIMQPLTVWSIGNAIKNKPLTLHELEELEDAYIKGDKAAREKLDGMARDEGFQNWEELNFSTIEELLPVLENVKKQDNLALDIFLSPADLDTPRPDEGSILNGTLIPHSVRFKELEREREDAKHAELVELQKQTLAELKTRPDEAVKGEGEVAKKKKTGRNKLTRDEVKERREIVEKAKKMKKENPLMYWKQIAEKLDIPEKTLRDYRHKY